MSGDIFYFSILSSAAVLSLMGLWFAGVMPWSDRWSRRFFLDYFTVFLLCCLSSLVEMVLWRFSVPRGVMYFVVVLECLTLSLPLPMLTVYLLHCCGESPRGSSLLRAVLVLWAVDVALLAGYSVFGGFTDYLTATSLYQRPPLYPLLVLLLVAMLLLTLAGVIRRRARLSPVVFRGFLVAILPMTAVLIAQMFVDVFPLLDISYILSALSMYGLVLSDQIERDLRRQRELAEQQLEIAKQQLEIANQRASVAVLQMRPHFIYNTLMSIYSLCNQDPQKARQVTKDFTDYLRKNFNAVASDSAIPFSAELEHTRAYLAVEQAQFEDMLVVDYDTPFTRFRLPPLTLQPLVENAVKHGMDPYAGPLHVSVRTRHTDAGAEIVVTDNGRGFESADDSDGHVTLTNIRQRLKSMCGGSLTVAPGDGGGTVVTVTIPGRAADSAQTAAPPS